MSASIEKFREERLRQERLRELQADENSRSFKDVETYIKERDAGTIVLRDEATHIKRRDHIAEEDSNLATLIGNLVAKFKVVDDAFAQNSRKYLAGDELCDYLTEVHLWTTRREIAFALLKELEHARSLNLLQNVTIANNAKRLEELEQENEGLSHRIEALSAELKQCQVDFEAYKKHVHKSGGDTEIGSLGR